MAVNEQGYPASPRRSRRPNQTAEGDAVTGVNGYQFNLNRLTGAIAGTGSGQPVKLLLPRGDEFEIITLDYTGGLRYADLVRDENRPDRFAEIFSPRAGNERADQK